MSNFINATQATYQHFFYELTDHRTDDWLLMSSPWPCVTTVILYISFVKTAPQYMKDRPAFKLDKIIYAYNLMQFLSCVYIVVNACSLAWENNYRVICEPVNYNNNPEALKIAEQMWYYLLLKIVDLLDTVFFILRKQEEKATCFHVFHHSAMVLVSWMFLKFFPGGHVCLSGVLITLSRVWLYGYYILTHSCPHLINPVWLRRRYNEILMVFSAISIIHSLPVLFLEDCGFPKFPIVILCTTASLFLAFFCKFYAKTYLKEKTA